MAHLLQSCTYISKSLCLGKNSWKIGEEKRNCLMRCSSSRSSAVSNLNGGDGNGRRMLKETKHYLFDLQEYSYLVSDQYGWKVRRLEEDDPHEMRKVAFIQAEAFHITMPLFDDLFFHFFKAEVLSGLLYKLRNSPPNRYACLVAEPATSKSNRKIVGVVDVTVLRDAAVLQHLQGEEEYLYVSGLAVSKTFRRKKIASVLLKASEVLSNQWGFRYAALRVYEDDLGARKLYTNAGYQVVSADPSWMTTLIGRKRRLLMIKHYH